MAACEKCVALEREVEALKKEKGELEVMLHKRLRSCFKNSSVKRVC